MQYYILFIEIWTYLSNFQLEISTEMQFIVSTSELLLPNWNLSS